MDVTGLSVNRFLVGVSLHGGPEDPGCGEEGGVANVDLLSEASKLSSVGRVGVPCKQLSTSRPCFTNRALSFNLCVFAQALQHRSSALDTNSCTSGHICSHKVARLSSLDRKPCLRLVNSISSCLMLIFSISRDALSRTLSH